MAENNKYQVGDTAAIRNYPRVLHRYERLIEIATDLVSSLELNTILEHIVHAAKELTECQSASLLLFDPQTEKLYFEAATDQFIEQRGQLALPTKNSIAGWVFTYGESALVNDVLQDPRFYAEVDVLTHHQTESILCVPLRLKQKTLGVIEAVNKKEGLFDEDDARILQAVATQASIAIENNRLFIQSDLIAEMVHELRSPLTALTAAGHLLQRSDLGDEQRNKLRQTILNEALRLDTMAGGFLDLARLESGRAHFIREPVHLGGLVEECLEIIRPQADAEMITLETDLGTSIAPVMGDRHRLKQLLLNLLTNAIKYNKPQGKVNVSLRSDGADVLLAVEDTGCGIPSENLPHIFERFYRVPKEEGDSQGAGLGLAIAKRIAETHQGSIEVESKSGVGSTFTVRIPTQPTTDI
ncbi:MAG: ATP-binding protein [Anaerolineales bacterium]